MNDKDVWFNLAAGTKLRDIMAFAPFLWNIIDIAFHREFNSSLDFDFFRGSDTYYWCCWSLHQLLSLSDDKDNKYYSV